MSTGLPETFRTSTGVAVRTVLVSAEGIQIEHHGGARKQREWKDFSSIWLKKTQLSDLWIFESESQRVKIRKHGFTSAQWWDLSDAIRWYKAAGPVETLPGVEAEAKKKDVASRKTRARPEEEKISSQEEDAAITFSPQYPGAILWGPWFFAACTLVIVPMAYGHYQDGTWATNPMESILLPFCVALMIGFGALWLKRMATKIVFESDAMVIEQPLGRAKVVRYEEVTDFSHINLRTQQGTFILGEKNSDAFFRLLEPHLREDQLSGDMSSSALYEMLALPAFFVFAPALCALVWWLDVRREWTAIAYSAAVVGAFVCWAVVAWTLKKWNSREPDGQRRTN